MRLCWLLGLLLVIAAPAGAQEGVDALVGGAELGTRSVQLIALITILSLVPGIAVMVTCFPFVVTVLSILRQAIGLQSAPPNMVIVSLAMFLSWFIMDPVLTEAWNRGAGPYSRGEMTLTEAIPVTVQPFRSFMAGRVDPDTFAEMQALRPGEISAAAEAPLSLLVPSFLLSEIQRAFEIGFLIFLPFLIIDLVVAAVLMSMGMMMVPPAIVSLPFKLAFFVVADGWGLLSSALVRSYF
ncbi:flagellar type III secretion system pore protein FliP [Gemmobacter caeruleus]|uniref:flagellar type III secretion system pore protein FliP n=1 Tax=Gemmobacter caeruleus TaxID=2595004 RepID=UPI0011EBCA46|nr:flagellar type III secretion system pore protein FliP [Gemmobacter caeruleus]